MTNPHIEFNNTMKNVLAMFAIIAAALEYAARIHLWGYQSFTDFLTVILLASILFSIKLGE